MKELLEKLKILDRECYDEIERGLEQADIEYEEDIIQGACVRVMGAIGYPFSLAHIWPKASLPAYEWRARVFIDPDNIIETLGDSPAWVVLKAYIEVIRSRL